ncbi:MAG: hypothetical protein ABIG64_09310 [Candidatus Omnitrophota bacterium]
MKFDDFIKTYRESVIIDSSTFNWFSDKPQDVRRQVRYWVKKGYLISLKKGIYILSDNYRKINLSRGFLANFLVSPSYLSLEYALGFYGLIPEKVTVYTSITTKKTAAYKNYLGVFEYRSLKKDLFFGFTKVAENNQEFFIAQPEKAILDFFYFRKEIKGKAGEFESLRFQNLETLDIAKLQEFSKNFTKKVNKIAQEFVNFVVQENREWKTLK